MITLNHKLSLVSYIELTIDMLLASILKYRTFPTGIKPTGFFRLPVRDCVIELLGESRW